MGCFSVAVNSFKAGTNESRWVKLLPKGKKGKVSGEIQVEVSWKEV
jgi:hypothetical protein